MSENPFYSGPLVAPFELPKPSFRELRQIRERELGRSYLEIIGIDPGGKTGVSILSIPSIIGNKPFWDQPLELILSKRISWVHFEVDTRAQEELACWALGEKLASHPAAAIVCESFILRPQRRESSEELLSPVRIIARLKARMWLEGRLVHEQSPAQAKTTCTDDRLKLWKVYTPEGGLGHARDADRHVILFLRRVLDHSATGRRLRQVAWPHVYVEQEKSHEAL